MFKSVKVTEETYKKAIQLKAELEKTSDLAEMEGVNLSTAIGYAVAKMLERKERLGKMRSAAGGWADVDARELTGEIYKSRSRPPRG